MIFPFWVAGTFYLKKEKEPERFIPILKETITAWLIENRARDVTKVSNIIQFKSPILYTRLNPIGSINFGRLEVNLVENSIEIRYRLKFTRAYLRLLLFILLVQYVLPFPLILGSHNSAFLTILLIWFIFICFHSLVALYTFPKEIRNIPYL